MSGWFILSQRRSRNEDEQECDLMIQNCPMNSDWRDWDLGTKERFKPSSHGAEAAIQAARKAERADLLWEVEAKWETALDDESYQSAPPRSHFQKGYPSHIHTEFTVDGERVHVDRLEAKKFGPGRAFLEFRIFVDGQLVGRAGAAGTSLGAGSSDFPAVALVGENRILTVDRHATLRLWRRL
jgi:hypothetical protein